MGGLARAAGGRALTGPLWLDGGGAALAVSPDAPTIWWFSLDDPATRRLADSIAPLPDEGAAFAHRRDAGERLIRRRLARSLLAAAVGGSPADIHVTRDPAGALVVTAPAGWHLSVAARWPDAIVGIAREALGVDLERVTAETPLADVLTPDEAQWLRGLAAADRSAAFAQCWAAKEAHAKWTRQPRSLAPIAIEAGGSGVVKSRLGSSRCWRRRHCDLVAAVCVAI